MVIDISIPKTKDEYKKYLTRLEALADTAMPGTPAGEEYEILSLLVREFEEKTFIFPSVSPIEILKFRMDQLDLRPVDLVKYIGHKASVSRILKGERQLTIEMVRNLSKGLNIPIELLVQ